MVPSAEVVGAHEPPRPIGADRLPVVTAEADRPVVDMLGIDAPMTLERVRQRCSVEIPRLGVHASTLGGVLGAHVSRHETKRLKRLEPSMPILAPDV